MTDKLSLHLPTHSSFSSPSFPLLPTYNLHLSPPSHPPPPPSLPYFTPPPLLHPSSLSHTPTTLFPLLSTSLPFSYMYPLVSSHSVISCSRIYQGRIQTLKKGEGGIHTCIELCVASSTLLSVSFMCARPEAVIHVQMCAVSE